MTTALKPFRLTGASRASIAARHTSLVNGCLRLLKAHGIKADKMNSGGMKDSRGHWYRFGFPGCPDILGTLPGGKHLAIECKTGTGRLTPEQAEYRREVEELGAVFVLVREIGDLTAALSPWLTAAPARQDAPQSTNGTEAYRG